MWICLLDSHLGHALRLAKLHANLLGFRHSGHYGLYSATAVMQAGVAEHDLVPTAAASGKASRAFQ